MADYAWNAARGQFRDTATGQYVGLDTLQGHVETVIRAGQARIATLTDRLTSQAITPAVWDAQVSQVLSSVHLTSGALAHGGWAALDAPMQQWVAGRLSTQLDYLSAFRAEIEAGGLSDAQIAARAAMYPEAAHATYMERRRADGADRGQDQERNILGSGNSCEGCAAASAQGWVPIGTLEPVGGRDCRSRCRCSIQTRRSRVRVEA